MEDNTLDEVETLPEYSAPRLNFVIVLPRFEKEVFSELDRTMKLLKDPEQDSPKEESQKTKVPKLKEQVEEAKNKRKTYSPRRFFSDGWNSLWHFVFGVFAIKFQLMVPFFILYQCLDLTEKNIFVDIWEFLVGYIFGYVFYLF